VITEMRHRSSALAFIVTIACASSAFAQQQWLEAKGVQYSVFYDARYVRDVEKVRAWLDAAERLMASKYQLPRHNWTVSVYLYPEPTDGADTGTATITSSGTTATIKYLTPSSPLWASAGKSELGETKNTDDYHAQVITHEYITVAHQAINRSAGWTYYGAPAWVYQGLEQYDGIFHSTETNRQVMPALLARWGNANRHLFACCTTLNGMESLAISDRGVYAGGALLWRFLAERFGEDIHRKILISPATSFEAALIAETQAVSLAALFEQVRSWSNGWRAASVHAALADRPKTDRPTTSVTTAEPQWLQARGGQYSIFYDARYSSDVEKVRTWLDAAERLMASKYQLPRHNWSVSVYLYPEPTSGADTDTATIDTTGTAATIKYLTPSSPQWATSKPGELGETKNTDDYHAQVITHEYVTVAHQVINQSAGWTLYSAPSWVYQGLEQYDGIFNSTEANRQAMPALLARWVSGNPTDIVCCRTLGDGESLEIGREYAGGALAWLFLKEQFGEDVHRRILISRENSFVSALLKETGTDSVSTLFGQFQSWTKAFVAKYPPPPPPPDIALVTPAGGAVSVVEGSGQTRLTFSARYDWTLSIDVPWLTFEAYSGGPGTYGRDLKFGCNPEPTPRVGIVTIRSGQGVATVTVTQLRGSPGCTDINPNADISIITPVAGAVSVLQDSGQTRLTFYANAAWTLSIDVPWLTFELTSGERGTYGRNLLYTANPDRVPRVGVVTIRSGASTATVTVTQAARP
jgi:hypothetical protein